MPPWSLLLLHISVVLVNPHRDSAKVTRALGKSEDPKIIHDDTPPRPQPQLPDRLSLFPRDRLSSPLTAVQVLQQQTRATHAHLSPPSPAPSHAEPLAWSRQRGVRDREEVWVKVSIVLEAVGLEIGAVLRVQLLLLSEQLQEVEGTAYRQTVLVEEACQDLKVL